MHPRFDGYFLSGLQRREEWHAGVHMVEDYFDYLKFYEDGLWLRKSSPRDDLDFRGYLSGVGEQAFRDGLAGRDPLDREYDFVHQTGRYSLTGDRIALTHRYFLIQMFETCWSLRLKSPERLVSESGAVYLFHPIDPAR